MPRVPTSYPDVEHRDKTRGRVERAAHSEHAQPTQTDGARRGAPVEISAQRHVQVPLALIADTQLTDLDKMVWIALAARCISSPTCWPARGTIAADVGKSDAHHDTITSSTARLRAAGWLKTTVTFSIQYGKSRTEYEPQGRPVKGKRTPYVAVTNALLDPLYAGKINTKHAATFLALGALRASQRGSRPGQVAEMLKVSAVTLRRHLSVLRGAGLVPPAKVKSDKKAGSVATKKPDRYGQKDLTVSTSSTEIPLNAERSSARAALSPHQGSTNVSAARAQTLPHLVLQALPGQYRTAAPWIRAKLLPIIEDTQAAGISARAIIHAVPALSDQEYALNKTHIPVFRAAVWALRIDCHAGTRCRECGQLGVDRREACEECNPDRPWSAADQAALNASPLRVPR